MTGLILHLVTQREPAGAQAIAVELARQHRACGRASEVWYLYRKSSAFDDEPGLDLTTVVPGPWGTVRMLAQLWWCLRTVRPAAVIAHTHWCLALALPIAALAGVPVRIGVHHSLRDLYPRPCRWLERWWGCLGVATRLVAVAEPVAATFGGAPPSYRRRLTTIPNGVRPLPDPVTNTITTDHRPLIVAIGRLSVEKNHRLLIACLADLPGVRLVIAGEGPLRPDLRKLAEGLGVADRLQLPGALNRQELANLVAEAALVVLPSLSEGLSLALVEALGSGTPVIASDLPPNRAAADGAARLVPPGDQAALVAAIRDLLTDPEARARMGAAGRRRATDFDPARMAADYVALLDDQA